ncbi:hypothetical protein AA103196_1099 [Ameyamaea chiangmaiensis NBRC 103196]|uniref:SMEK domain-containing protein n=2 Tax=Acetobacteraceae TaxID=433 RepID=A0A850PEP2_9PROT|nr:MULTISPECIES: SMEK domain-containing protein [Acetobacteraceae]MBB2199048.1 SMEK domain-containing protein [Gluconacetobacter dulcium]MBS4076340.1 SMEK domain-containing protein [Ameyamaea chiangmaiensis]NVN40930.1 SMEK domain-containing protein [Ameyamaea chiangmaiensis]GBQ65291.1 hypothetical protein AA103196_1099 [Ameyamaea chiangmaiensis NBRC 103196]
MKRAAIFDSITNYLSYLTTNVKTRSSLNLLDFNVHSEMFFRDFLNIIFDYNLININIIKKNARAIDLGDTINKIAIQVTSTNDIAKIKHTHKGFVADNLQTVYDRLIILIIGEKKDYRESSIGNGTIFELSVDDDVWGLAELLTKIGNLGISKLEVCLTFLEENLALVRPREANEVNTLVRLIEVLSQTDEEIPVAGMREDPDPDGKINDRFADHADFLRRQYIDLHELYGVALSEVTKQSELSHVRVRKLQIYLSNWSDRLLTQHRGDPRAAMDALVAEMIQKMGKSDQGYDESAIRYYVIDQLIACNVFPNKIAQYA